VAQDSAPVSVIGSLAGEDKPKEGEGTDKSKDTQSVAAPDLEISLPEGVKPDEAMLKEFKDLAKEAGLDGAKASKLVAWDIQRQQKLDQQMSESVKQLNAEWDKQLKADKDFGGEKMNVTMATAKKALRKFGGEELARELDAAGIGNHPGLIKFFSRVGQALGEDDSFAPKSAGTASSEQQTMRQLYPSMFNADGTPKQ
jgi:hypothetical protein